MTKILVISDLHAYTPSATDKGTPPSFLVNAPRDVPPNPVSAIGDVIRDEGLEVDWLICPGDIADKADPASQKFAWSEINKLGTAVNARVVLGTVGNHDVDSRLKHSTFDPKGFLLNLSPPYPGGSETLVDKYWARNYHIHVENGVRLLNLNSAAFHGYHSEEVKNSLEYLHGRVSQPTIDAIVSEVRSVSANLNILLTHHHPYRNNRIYATDYSEMAFGDRLIDALSEATNSSWLVIHGHQHYPSLTYGMGAVHQAVIFSAGSVSATLESPLATEAPNQFYHITLELDARRTCNWMPCGTVKAWHWAQRRKWERSPYAHNIPYESGFGCRENPISIAQAIAHIVLEGGRSPIDMNSVVQRVPYIAYVNKTTLDAALQALKSLGVHVTRAELMRESILRPDNGVSTSHA